MTKSIPNYELYGDFLAGGLPGPIHHETIKERSSKHNWTIRLHRHKRLAQIFLFNSPGVLMRLGDVELTSSEQTVLVIPPETVHGFLFSEDVIGDVISIRLDEMPQKIQQRSSLFTSSTDNIFSESKSANFENITELMGQLRKLTKALHRIKMRY